MTDPAIRGSGDGGGLLACPDARFGLTERPSLPRLTTCYEHAPVRPSLTGRRLLYAVYLCVLVAGFGLAHVHLRFKIADLRLQTQQLQKHARQLLERAEALERRNIALAGLDHVETVARETLGMTDMAAPDALVAEISRRLIARYSSIRAESPLPPDGTNRASAVEDAVLAALPPQTPPEFLDAVLEISRALVAATGAESRSDTGAEAPAPGVQRVVEFRFVEPTGNW